jgi:glycosyltransferase involved in cell wall biosynthesis
MTGTPLISVQVPVRNPGAGFSVFLGSLASQEGLDFDWELVVADDGSASPVAGAFDLEASRASRVVSVRLEGPGNRPRARNAALAAASAPVVFFADADLRYEAGVLRAHADAHRKPAADVFRGSRINAWAPDSTAWQKWFDTRGGNLAPAGPMPWRHFVTGNSSARARLILETGGFDEAIDRYGGEDTELGYRLHLADASFARDPGVRAFHLDIVSARRHCGKMLEYGAGGLKYTLEKHPGIGNLLGSSWLAPLASRPVGLLPARVLARAALIRPVYRTALKWAETFGRPSPVFTYLSVASCLRGLSGRGM